MNTHRIGRRFLALYIALILGLSAFAPTKALSVSPTLSITNSGSSQLSVVVYGDPNAIVYFQYYDPNNIYHSVGNIGSTNGYGSFSTIIDASSYGIPTGSRAFIIVNAQQSSQVTIPYYSSYGYGGYGTLGLSQSNLTLSSGQSVSVTATYGGYGIYISTVSTPGIVSTSISGNQVTFTGQSSGSTNVTICAANYNCATVYVTVQSGSYYYSSSGISFSQINLNLTPGQNGSVTLSGGSGSYYLSNQYYSNYQNIIQATLSGNTLTVIGQNPGTASINVCSTNANCGTISVTVTGSTIYGGYSYYQQPYNYYPYNSGYYNYGSYNYGYSGFGLSTSNATVDIGQTQIVSIIRGYDPNQYYSVQNNTNPNSIGIAINGNVVYVIGRASGVGNVTICNSQNQCTPIVVTVTNNYYPY